MPIRTYSPSATSALGSFGSKYSANITSSPLSVGNYKPLSGHSPSTTTTLRNKTNDSSSSKLSAGYGSGSSIGSASLRCLSTSSYSPSSSSLHSGSYSSLSSTSSSSSSSISSYNNNHSTTNGNDYSAGHYIPRGSFTTGSSRYSPTSSTASSSLSTSRSAASPTTISTPSSRYSSGLTNTDSSTTYSSHRSPLTSTRSSHYTPTTTTGRYSTLTSTRRPSQTNSSSTSITDRYAVEQLPADVPKGLVNLGNTCYMNASIQSLYAIDTFKNFVLRSPYDKTLTSELADLFKSMKNSTSPISPANFKYAFSRYQQKFSGFGQQDAQEFLRYLINGIHEEFNAAAKRPRRSVPPKAPRNADEAWGQYTDIVDDSPLVNIVVGQMCSTIVCSDCQNKSCCWDPFWDLSLPLMRGRRPVRLSEIIQDFTATESLESDERPMCSVCKKATRSTKQISLCRLPKLLILHLKKFSNDGYKLTSPDVTVDKTLTFNGTTYHLKACISHHGHSSSSGHYTSHCEYSGRWFHFNDDRVRDVTNTFDSSKLDDAYVLFYTHSLSRGSISQSKL